MKTITTLLVLSCWAFVLMIAINTRGASPIPDWYYNSPCQQPAGVSLEDWLTNLEWVPYEKGVYDCTEMSARIEWMAENCGYNAVIGCDDDHCWALVEGVAFEPTGNYWVAEDHTGDDDYYHPDTVYGGISVDPAFDWWLVHPELLGGK